MTITAISKSLRVIEFLASRSRGATLSEVSTELGIPRAATLSVLRSLESRGFVRVEASSMRYALTMKLAKLGMFYVARSGMSEVYQPIIDRIASETGELVRLSLALGDHLTWVGMAQGSRNGLRIAPDTGRDVCLHATAAGKAWLATMSLERAVKLVLERGFGQTEHLGPSAITSIEAFLIELKLTKRLGYGMSIDEYIPGMSAVAASIPGFPLDGPALGTISIAGPTARMSRKHLRAMVPLLIQGTSELSALAPIISAQSRG